MTREEVQQAINDGRMIHIFDKRFNYYRTIQPYMYIIEIFDENGFEMHTRDVYPYTTYYFKYEDCTLDEEKVKEHNEFGNITRTERLELPSWQDFVNGKVVEFVSNKLLYELKKCGERIYISYRTYIDDSIWEIIFEKPLVKENYDEARRLCVKLFKGEEV